MGGALRGRRQLDLVQDNELKLRQKPGLGLPELTDEGLVNAQLTHISSDSIAAAQAYFEGRLDGCEEDEHTADVGRLTRELRRRILSRPLASESFLRQVLRTT